MPVNHDYDDLFDGWGRAFNVNPQLGKTVFHIESGGNPNAPNGTSGEIGPMQIMPATGRYLARQMGFDPKTVDLRDMRWAVPLAMRYLAEGLNATQSAEGALGYYNTGSADPKRWRPSYLEKGRRLYGAMALTPSSQPDAEDLPVPPIPPDNPPPEEQP